MQKTIKVSCQNTCIHMFYFWLIPAKWAIIWWDMRTKQSVSYLTHDLRWGKKSSAEHNNTNGFYHFGITNVMFITTISAVWSVSLSIWTLGEKSAQTANLLSVLTGFIWWLLWSHEKYQKKYRKNSVFNSPMSNSYDVTIGNTIKILWRISLHHRKWRKLNFDCIYSYSYIFFEQEPKFNV